MMPASATSTSSRTRAGARIALVMLLAIIALNALGGAWYGLAGAEDVPRRWLDGSPFDSYVVPSLYLGIVVGGAHLAALTMLVRHHAQARLAAYVASGVLASWIIVQVLIIGYVSALQPVMLAAAAVTALLATVAFAEA